VPGQPGDVAGLDPPGEQRGGAEDVAQAVPGPRPPAVVTAPSRRPVGRHEDPAAEVVRAPVPALRRGEHQTQRVVPRFPLAACCLDTGSDPVGQRVALRGPAGVDGAPPLAVLGCFLVQPPADLDDLAVHGDGPTGLVDLPGGKRDQLAPPQPGVGGELSHQLVYVRPAFGQGLAELGNIGMRGDLGGIDEQR
jgi:hypothetical protein